MNTLLLERIDDMQVLRSCKATKSGIGICPPGSASRAAGWAMGESHVAHHPDPVGHRVLIEHQTLVHLPNETLTFIPFNTKGLFLT